MGLLSFIHGKTGRLILHRLYGIGAALVIMGALFKLMHWNGAATMLTIGMTTECIIFFLSAFEPMAKEYDWSLVYPEFAGDDGEIVDIPTTRNNAAYAHGGIQGGGFNLDLDPAMGDELKDGIKKLSGSLGQMASLTGVVDASTELKNNMLRASGSMVGISESANILTENYQKTAQTVNAYNEQSKASLEQIRTGYDNYRGQLDNLGRTMGAVNSSYELYLQEAQKVQNDYNQLHGQMAKLIGNVQSSIDETQKFGNQMAGLNDNIGKLNSIYGSMLTAVNSIINK